MPERWEVALGYLARDFHFQPSELMAMDIEDLGFWLEQWEETKPRG